MKASYGVNELSAEEVAQLARLTMTDITILNKRVKIHFVKPFDTIEKLIRLAKIGIEEMGYDEFTNYILSHKDECIQTIKKSPECSNLVDTTCIKWWERVVGTRTEFELVLEFLITLIEINKYC